MQMTRRFTREGSDPFASLTFVPRASRIVNPNGSVVFEMKDVMVPEGWSPDFPDRSLSPAIAHPPLIVSRLRFCTSRSISLYAATVSG